MKRMLLLLIPVVIIACNKEAGPGGLASISGKLYLIDLNGTGTDTVAEHYLQDERVYIVYGADDATFDDDTRTSHDGSFRFDGLREGDYTIFAYTRCDTCLGYDAVEERKVTISDKKEHVVLDDIIVFD